MKKKELSIKIPLRFANNVMCMIEKNLCPLFSAPCSYFFVAEELTCYIIALISFLKQSHSFFFSLGEKRMKIFYLPAH